MFVQRLVRSKRSSSAEDELVSVGSSLGDAVRAIHAASSPNVFDEYLLAQELREPRTDYPCEEIIPAPSREGNYHSHRARRPALRNPGSRCCREHHHSGKYFRNAPPPSGRVPPRGQFG